MWEINSVKKTCLVVLLPLFLVVILLLSGMGYYFSRMELMKAAGELVRSQGQNISSVVDKDINEKMIRLEELANIKGFAELSQTDKVKVLSAAKARYRGFSMIAFADANGQAISETGQPMDRGSREYIKKSQGNEKSLCVGSQYFRDHG